MGHAHPLPRIDDILDSLGDSKYFTTLDLRSGYWQISVDEHDRHKTAFGTLNTYSNITYPCGWLGATGGRSYFANRNNYLDSGQDI